MRKNKQDWWNTMRHIVFHQPLMGMRNTNSEQKILYIDVVSDVFVLFHWALIVRGRCTLFGMYFLAGAGMKFGLLSVMEKRTPCSGGVI